MMIEDGQQRRLAMKEKANEDGIYDACIAVLNNYDDVTFDVLYAELFPLYPKKRIEEVFLHLFSGGSVESSTGEVYAVFSHIGES